MNNTVSALAIGIALSLPAVALGQLPGMSGGKESAAKAEPASGVDQVADQAKSLLQRIDLGDVYAQNTWTSWLILLGGIFAGLVVGKIVAFGLRRVGGRMADRGWAARGEFLAGAASPVSLVLLTIGLGVGLSQIEMGPALSTFCAKVVQLLITVAVFWYLFNLVAVIEIAMRRVTARTAGTLDDMIVPLIRKTLRIFLVVVGVLFVLDGIFDADIGAWLAGLGIVGLAVSLAAQDSLKNVFGSITILLDRPFQVGERINYGGYDGFVEAIGFRSTKVRTLTGHQVSVPNATIVNDAVENIGRRPYIRRIINITITYDTPTEKVERAAQIVRDILEEPGIAEEVHPTINGDPYPPRVYFSDFNAASLNIFVIYWHRTETGPDWFAFMEHGHKVNMRILEEYEKAGIDFAFPTQTLYLAGDEKRRLAVQMLGRDTDASP